MKYFKVLRFSVIKDYLDKKDGGHLFLFYNANNRKVTLIPKRLNHVDLVSRLLDVDLIDITNSSIDVSYLVPVTLSINENKYESALVGVSSMEMGYGVRHKKEDLINAGNATDALLQRGPLEMKENFQNVVSMEYALK